ncbi:unnamed protein product [Medioppia subpectinata]|uniref:2-phosphoxylose phosphatase 1 n=1 Tax=Medioppia subpectinata TaxID=1979941 RepID=A0A7R9KPQ1_9ACAR|nr:unnamed protein product [Medioppia subpectinata]CAG2106243.1 unnamed protein product [Medioppia subpectinata]
MITFHYMNGNIEYNYNSMPPIVHNLNAKAVDVFDKWSTGRMSRIQVYCNPFTTIAANDELFNISAVITDLSLSQVSVVIRHGDRGPLRPTPKSWCELGGLTRYGCVQHLTLGSLLATIYTNQLNLKPRHMKVWTTPYPRTYQSALAFVYGFLRPKTVVDFETSIVHNLNAKAVDVFDKWSTGRMSRIQVYCNPFTTIAANDELFNISVVITDLSLSQVSVVIRHGDRGPLRPVRHMSSINRIKYLSKNFAKTPKSWCELGGLTRYGCVQHLTLGSLLATIYSNQLNLKPRHMKVWTTPYPRTYQSALAFVYGFLRPKTVVDFETFPQIMTTIGTHFCQTPQTSQYCLKRCKKLDVLHKIMNENKKQLLSSHPAVVQLLSDLKSIIAQNSNETHDITIVSITSALNFFDGNLPPYASRVIFETYRHLLFK